MPSNSDKPIIAWKSLDLMIFLLNEFKDIFGDGFHTSFWYITSWVVGLLLWFFQDFYGHPLAPVLRFHKLGIVHKLLGTWVLVEINDLEVLKWSSLTHVSPIILRSVKNSWIWPLDPLKFLQLNTSWAISPRQLFVVRTIFIWWFGKMFTIRKIWDLSHGEINTASRW